MTEMAVYSSSSPLVENTGQRQELSAFPRLYDIPVITKDPLLPFVSHQHPLEI